MKLHDFETDRIIQDSNKHFIEEELIPFLKIPSTTSNPEGISIARDYLKSYISNVVEKTIDIPGIINPLTFSWIKGESKDTLLIYMMYDTQPVHKRENWIVEPFGGEIAVLKKPLDTLGDCIIARGAYNSKTPLMCFLNVLRILKERDQLPMSLLLVFDSEEEHGSPTLLKLLHTKKELFHDCVDAYYPAIKQEINETAVLKLGYKGILSLTMIASTDNNEVHSSFGSMIPNPVNDLISVLNSIYVDGNFKIDSLKQTYKINQEERDIMNKLSYKTSLVALKKKRGITQSLIADNEKSFYNYLFNPSFNISTIKSGFLDGGIKNAVPNSAECNIDIRYAHDVRIETLYQEIEKIVDNFNKNSISHIDLIKNIGYRGSRVKRDTNLISSMHKSFELLGVKYEEWPLSAAAAPLSRIKNELGLNFVVGGLGIGGNAHAPNEFIQIGSILNARRFIYFFLQFYAKLNKNRRDQ
ncbi:MAG: M20/M25/M40 family metallo-hydrolase [Candidatus Lokiarchaeota archaeon]|nr:M20/M25/M40 family metallo-hydrolase [Candidatus Lokiarchaeota archaeon]